MSETKDAVARTFHQHDEDIHVIRTDAKFKVIEHGCIAIANDGLKDAKYWADFIVRACNNHAGLLAVCRDLIDYPTHCTDLARLVERAEIAVGLVNNNS